MKDWVAAVRPYAELAYFIAGTLLLAGLALGIRQVRLLQEDAENRSGRSAKEKAIEACERYMDDHVPLYNKAFAEQESNDISSYEGDIGDFSLKSLNGSQDRLKNYELCKKYVAALNKLETISAYFTSEVADERTGFQIIGRTFCATVESLYEIISFTRSTGAHDYWSNIVQLYFLWRPRLNDAEIEAAIKALAAKKSNLST